MLRTSREFYNLRDQFEKDITKINPEYISKLKHAINDKKIFYQDNEVNELFYYYMMGFQYAKSLNNINAL